MANKKQQPLPLTPPHGSRVSFFETDNQYMVLSYPLKRTPLLPLPDSLTAAEREVAELLLANRSGSEIARARKTSMRTVANQIQSLYRKLGVSSRLELQVSLAPGEPARDVE